MEKRKPVVRQKGFQPESVTDYLEMQIPAQPEWVRVVRLATAGVASRVGFSYEEIEDIKLAVTEACNNAILHSTGPESGSKKSGNSESVETATTTATVKICWRVFEEGVRVSVTDDGFLASAEPLKRGAQTPTAEQMMEELPEEGMGLLLIESLMDETEHEAGPHINTTLHMTKYLQAGDSASRANGPGSSYPDPDSPVDIGALKRRSQALPRSDFSSTPKH